ncbi:hypothetical protein KI387_022903 [Taxus chinensis]|uniref:Cyclin-like domain-containing protein n=1 Tax=Taxus chinensis TaxID=29808 RepID=A0AA38G1A1_TAXCH|nr:hypothetical protein KI387_022903 [Taxus chinensis]
MEHIRGHHHFPIGNDTNILGPSSGYERGPFLIRNEGTFQNNARNLTRKFQESFHATGGYDNGPASKKRREVYLSNPLNVNNCLPFAWSLEDSVCNSRGINNYSAFSGRAEEGYCNGMVFNSSSVLSWRHEENVSDLVNPNSCPIARTDEFITGVSNNNDGFDNYLSRDEIERCSPSRRDGIDLQKETYFRYSYCAFLQTLGMRLQLPQTTIATAMVFCHRFFLRRSHATHDRFLVATAALFLAAKTEETPRPLNSVLIVSYEICHKHELENFHYLLPIDWFEQYKQCVLEAEQMVLTTLDFEVAVEHPYNPLMSVLNKIGLAQTVLVHVAWNLVSEGDEDALLNTQCPKNVELRWQAEVSSSVYATPLIADINSDGKLDIVVPSFVHYLEVLDGSDGDKMPGNGQCSINQLLMPGPLSQVGHVPSINFSCQPTSIDIDKDGVREIALAMYNGEVLFFRASGYLMAEKLEVPRLRARKDWYVGLEKDHVDRSHPDVHDDVLIQEAVDQEILSHSYAKHSSGSPFMLWQIPLLSICPGKSSLQAMQVSKVENADAVISVS